jgi:methionine synthase II (cobalamin-independent)
MFATLLGSLPRPPLGADAPRRALVEAAVRAQETAGIEPVTDGGLPGASDPVAAWQVTASLTERAVKQVLRGPYSLAWPTEANASLREAATLAHAVASNSILRALAAAGCPLIEIHEPSATAIGTDATERALFREAHLRLLDGLDGTHCSLVITGGSADAAGADTILAAPYASLAVDLIAGPDNWRLVADAPGEIGIVCGALSPAADGDDGPEVLLWAAAYAASTGARGPDRVGLATASSLAGLPWPDAIRKIERLGAAARLAEVPASEAVSSLDPRAVSSRAAALGYVGRDPSRGPRSDHDPT